MKKFILFIVLWLLVDPECFAQVASLGGGVGGPGSGGHVAQKNVTIVYNTATGQPDMVILDANNLSDPSWNPPGTKQISVPVATYNAMPDAVTFQGYMTSAITADVAANAPAP